MLQHAVKLSPLSALCALLLIGGSLSAADAPAARSGPAGAWEISGVDGEGITWKGFLVLSREAGVLAGKIDWLGSGEKSAGGAGREIVSATYNPQTRVLKLKGEKLEAARGLVLGTYQAELSDDGKTLANFRWLDGGAPGSWSATRSDKTESPYAPPAELVWEKKVFTSAKQGELPYRLLAPLGFDAKQAQAGAKTYPLVVFLHGAGERGADNERQIETGVPGFLTAENREKYACFLFAPQCPGKKPLVYWSDTVESGLVSHAIDFVTKNNPIDTKRIYVTGLSDGGWGTFALLARHPDKFAAAAPICGGGAPKNAANYAKVPIWIFHGLQDNVEPVTSSRNLFVALRKAGGDPQYTEYPNAGHDVWDRVYQNPKVYAWMFSQAKK